MSWRLEDATYTVGFGDGRRGHKPRSADNWKRQENGLSLRASSRNTALGHPDANPVRFLLDF